VRDFPLRPFLHVLQDAKVQKWPKTQNFTPFLPLVDPLIEIFKNEVQILARAIFLHFLSAFPALWVLPFPRSTSEARIEYKYVEKK